MFYNKTELQLRKTMNRKVEREPKIFIDCKDEEVILSKKIRTIDTFFVKDISMEKISRMVTKHGFTFNSF